MRLLFAAALLGGFFMSASAHAERCEASVYSIHDPDQNGTKTASGIPLNDRIATMARPHRKYLGTYATVTNLKNGRSATFRVTDLGPFKRGRCADLSVAAAQEIGCDGLCPVSVN